jgi:hypothetical protein
MFSYTVSETTTFTLTHAKHMAAKFAADLKRLQRFYGQPSDIAIANYETEVIELFKAGYFGTLTVGFRRNDQWIEPTLRYTARDLSGASANDNDPGRVRPGANTTGASFDSYLIYPSGVSEAEKAAFQKRMPFYRGGAPEPSINGYFVADLTYSAGGRALDRASVRSF